MGPYTEHEVNKPAEGKLLRCQLSCAGLPCWPADDSFPFQLNASQQAYLSSYRQNRLSKGFPKQAIEAQLNCLPSAFTLPLSIYTTPPRRISRGSTNAGHNAYCAKPELSGPTYMQEYLCSEVLSHKLASPKLAHFLHFGLGELLIEQAKTALLYSPVHVTPSDATSSGQAHHWGAPARPRSRSSGQVYRRDAPVRTRSRSSRSASRYRPREWIPR